MNGKKGYTFCTELVRNKKGKVFTGLKLGDIQNQ